MSRTISAVSMFTLLAALTSFGECPIPDVNKHTKTVLGREERIAISRGVLKQRDLRTTDPQCVLRAIRELGGLGDAEVIGDLIDVLDFLRPTDEVDEAVEKYGVVFRPPVRSRDYPAISALFQLGKPTLPALTRVLSETPPDSVVAENALQALMAIFREKPQEGVEYLRRAAIAHEDAEAAARLHTAADKAARVWIR